MAKKTKKKGKFNFTTTHELAEYLIELAEYLKSQPNIQLTPKEEKRVKVERIKIAKEKFEKEIEGKSLEDIKKILSGKKKKELEEIARGFNISSSTAKNIKKDELISVIIDNLRFPEKFEKLRKG